MDILDEIDAVIHEKKSKWSYTPMREKDETDAIIDELLREFPSGGYKSRGSYPERKTAEKTNDERSYIDRTPYEASEPTSKSPENEPYIGGRESLTLNEEQQERLRYETDADESEEFINDEASEVGENASPVVENDNKEYISENNAEEEYEAETGDNSDNGNEYTENDESHDERGDDYSEEDDESYDEQDDDYSEEDDESYDEQDDEYSEENNESYDEQDDGYSDNFSGMFGKGKNSQSDFNLFMDSENDGEKGDIPRFQISVVLKIIIKIILLAAFGAFAVVGITNILSNGLDKYEKRKNSFSGSDASVKEELQSVIYPLIVTNTKDFENASEISDEQIVDIAVWEIIINGNKSVFKDEESGKYFIPQDQISYVVEKLFGENVKFDHVDAGYGEIEIIYDKKNKRYIIPEDTDLYTFYPVVTDISDTDSSYMVYADCYIPTPSWNSQNSQPSKRVVLTLEKTSNYYNITSLRTIPTE